MLKRDYNGFNEFYQILKKLITNLEIFERNFNEVSNEYILGDNPHTNREINSTSRANTLATCSDVFKYDFKNTNSFEMVKKVYACFVYSYLRYSKNELYFKTLEYSEITSLTNNFDVLNLKSKIDMTNDINLFKLKFKTINQLDVQAQTDLLDLLHEIANLFLKPVQGFDIYLIQKRLQNSQDFQSYLHNITSRYFNYKQINSIKTFKSLKNYIRAIHYSGLIDISTIDDNVLKVTGQAFFGTQKYFDTRSKSKENFIFNFVKLSELLFDMSLSLNKPISVICNMISIIAVVDYNRLISMF
jgi:hypothetical protein